LFLVFSFLPRFESVAPPLDFHVLDHLSCQIAIIFDSPVTSQ